VTSQHELLTEDLHLGPMRKFEKFPNWHSATSARDLNQIVLGR